MTSSRDDVIIFRIFQICADVSTFYAIMWIFLIEHIETNQYYYPTNFYRYSTILWLEIAILIFDDVIKTINADLIF